MEEFYRAGSCYPSVAWRLLGTEILAKGHNRVDNPAVLARHQGEFPAVKLVSIQQAFGGWDEVTKNHFADGGILDQALATIH